MWVKRKLIALACFRISYWVSGFDECEKCSDCLLLRCSDDCEICFGRCERFSDWSDILLNMGHTISYYR